MATHTPAITKETYWSEYNDLFATELDTLDGDDNFLYRVDYDTTLLARSMAYAYNGTQTYIGVTGISKPQTEFLRQVHTNDYIEQLGFSRYAYGFNDIALNTLLGVRYHVYWNDPKTTNFYEPFGYQQISAEDDPYVIQENAYALPLILSYAYNESIDAVQLEQTPRDKRGLALLETCVVPEGYRHEGSSSPAEEPVAALVASDKTATPDSEVSVNIPASSNPFLIIEMDLVANSNESGDYVILVTLTNESSDDRLTIPYLTAAGNEHIAIPVKNVGYTKALIEFSHVSSICEPVLESIKIGGASEDYYRRYVAACEDKLAENPRVTDLTNTYVRGTLDAAEDGYLVTSIPFSNDWHVLIDGIDAETFTVNYGFVGAIITAGHHEIELLYVNNAFYIGAIATVLALAALIIARITSALVIRRKPRNASM